MNTATNLLDDLRLLEAPQPAYVWWLAVLALVVIAVAALAWRRRLARLRAQQQEVIATHAHEDALAALEKARALIVAGNAKPYAVEVSGIIRRYLEARFGLVAPKRSTEEFLIEAQQSPKLDARHRQSLAEFLGSCDFLKFARGLAELKELETMHQAAVRFVTETRVAPVAVTAQEVAA